MILIRNREPFVFQPSFPEGWNVRRLPGAGPHYWSGREGQVLMQRLQTPGFLVEYSIFRFIEQVSFLWQRRPGLQSLLSLQGKTEHRVEAGAMKLTSGSFVLIDGAGGQASTTVAAGEECHTLHTWYHPAFYNDFKEAFPQLEPAGREQMQDAFLSAEPQCLSTQAIDAVRTQFRDSYRPELQQKFFELKVKETLFALLAEMEGSPRRQLDARQAGLVEAARACISKDLSRHYSNQDIARAVGTNEADLKRWFRQTHGSGMFGFLQQLRFEKAHELLLYGDCTIKQVAAAVGYRHTTTFITEFRRYFGYTPSRLQKKR